MIIVWGGTGFLGSHIALELLQRDERVVITTHSRGYIHDSLREAVDRGDAVVEPVDLTSPPQVYDLVARHRPSGMIDASGYPPKALRPTDEVTRRIGALVNMLDAARMFEVGRVTLTSSMDAYWGLPNAAMPLQEDAFVPLQEQGDNFIVQSWAKKTLEVVASLFMRQNGQDIVTVRASGLYGPLYRTFLNLPSRLLLTAMRGDAADLPPTDGTLPVAGDGYDLTYIKDVARGIATVHLAERLEHRIYNVGSGRRVLHTEVIEAVQTLFPSFEPSLPSPQSGPSGPYMSIDRISRDLGYRPEYPIVAGIADYAEWLRSHER
jgi:nucleoside-diphosphate-sugar epimerase